MSHLGSKRDLGARQLFASSVLIVHIATELKVTFA
jgi:hypothetical protein